MPEAFQYSINNIAGIPQEKCGITAIASKTGENVSHLIPGMQDKLQHRGNDAAGMAVFNRQTGEFDIHTGMGYVVDVFPNDFDFAAHGLVADKAVGQNRYGTSERNGDKDGEAGAQPITSEWEGRKVTIAYNGNLPQEERDKLRSRIPEGLRKKDSFDTEDIADAIVSAPGVNWQQKIRSGLDGVNGAYSLTILTDSQELFGLRGPSGTWPLWVGESDSTAVIASETRVEGALGEKMNWREIQPGELVEVTSDGVKSRQIFIPTKEALCSLHATYGAKHDSLMTGEITYGEFRKIVGRKLAKEYPLPYADLIIGVPNGGLDIADGYARSLGRRVDSDVLNLATDPDGKEKRSYIAKTVEEAAAIVNDKFEPPNREVLEGKSIVVIDDSLIKGVTAGGDKERGITGTVQLLRDAGASKIHFLTGMPKFTAGCDMGYVIKEDRLVAIVRGEDGLYHERSSEEIATQIGADSFGFVSVESLKEAFEEATGRKDIACTACLGGEHPLVEGKVQQIVPVYAK